MNLALLGIGVCSSAATISCAKEQVERTERPNVVFIYADDLGRGLLSHYGQEIISTPNIDRIFEGGTYFENAHGCQYSSPARASLLTGYHDCRTDKWTIQKAGQFIREDIEEALPEIEARIDSADIALPEGDLTLSQVFKRAGYVTGEVGKLEWGFSSTRKQMERHEWDYYYGYLDHVRCHGYFPPFLFENGELVWIEGNTHLNCSKEKEADTPENHAERWDMTGKVQYSQNLFLEKILDFIRINKDKPFFLYHPTQLPHGPVSVPEIHPELVDVEGLTEFEREYALMVKMLDDHVGIILDELERLRILDNTIIIFSADNGHETYYQSASENRCRKPAQSIDKRRFDDWDYPYTSELTGDIFDGNDGQSGKKRSTLEGGVRVPLAFMWKGKIAKGRENEQLTANYDLLPTFADLLGVELAYEKDGVSLLPILLDGEESLKGMRYVHVNSLTGNAVLDSEGWKLRHNKHKNEFKLYNLREDYDESDNVYKENPDVVERLMGEIIIE